VNNNSISDGLTAEWNIYLDYSYVVHLLFGVVSDSDDDKQKESFSSKSNN